MLHLDVFRQRLEDEHDMYSIITAPTVSYRCKLRNIPDLKIVDNPLEAPPEENVEQWHEAIVSATIITPAEYAKGIKTLCDERRGVMTAQEFLNNSKVVNFTYDMPLSELITDFFDKMKSLSSGYASLDYDFKKYEPSDIVKVVFHLNGEPVDALTFLIHNSRAVDFSKGYCRRLKELLPAQLFKIAIQGKIGGKVIAREDIKAVRKDVTAKCYGGDVTRKRKLLEK
jgi:GTP-binding protein LepA